ncbi:helix-turn-helix domain-containing protein [Mycobacterium sp. NPDC003449]
MAWSTREIAELAGTSLRAVRHYHDVGLLAEPERRSNGYKQYGVDHLVRLVRIKRLVELGFSLPQIDSMGTADDHPEPELRALDAELAAMIDRLHCARAELGTILRRSTPIDLPAEFVPAAAAARLSDADRRLLVVLSRVLGPRGLRAYADLLDDDADEPEVSAFDDLPADADERTRRRAAELLATHILATWAAHPGLREAMTDAPRGERFAQKAIAVALTDLYNPAQLDVLRRARLIVHATAEPAAS